MLGWVLITPEGDVRVAVASSEMGQGVYSNLAMLVAEELDVDFARVRPVPAPVAKQFSNPKMFGGQITGGSTSTAGYWQPMREAGATARALLLKAAAARWNVSVDQLKTDQGQVLHPNGKRLSYGELAQEASQLDPPWSVKLKSPKSFRLIGQPVPRSDTPPKTRGEPIFGVDVRRPNMVHAAIRHAPAFQGQVKKVVNQKAIEKRPEVLAVIVAERWVAVVATHWWQAQRALDALELVFTTEGRPAPSTSDQRLILLKALDDHGKRDLKGEKRALDLEYEVPFLDHATMSPMNCTAHVTDTSCDVWVPTQAQTASRAAAAEAAGLDSDQVQIHTTYLGGGFGRRSETDFVTQAVTIAKKVKRPVKLIWTRSETTQHGAYRPAVISRFQVALDEENRPHRWYNQMAMPNIFAFKQPKIPDFVWGMTGDFIGLDGAKNPPYATGSKDVDSLGVDLHTPLGYWRAVGHSHNGFFVECVVDELAHLAGEDPVAFRRRFYDDHPRHRAVLDALDNLAKWSQPRPKGHHLGVAVHESFGSVVGQVVELSVSAQKVVTLHRIWCVIDCGFVVNPDTVKSQMEGGIVYGLSAATRGEITLKDGAVEQSSFHDYPIMSMHEIPPIDIKILTSGDSPTGVGETSLPPIAPAVANALFHATQQRIRRLPFSRAGFSQWRAGPDFS